MMLSPYILEMDIKPATLKRSHCLLIKSNTMCITIHIPEVLVHAEFLMHCGLEHNLLTILKQKYCFMGRPQLT